MSLNAALQRLVFDAMDLTLDQMKLKVFDEEMPVNI